MSTASKKPKAPTKPVKTAMKGVATQTAKHNARDFFASTPLAPEADNVGRKMRPTGHAPAHKARAKRVTAIVKRLSGKSI